mmetsp:Transcript_25030/g.59580  ORF Transcript_25030/g.59580 Transcript_25030/m.59580 type:complete len:242 (-) Transcript_25030:230-955(-)
MCERVGPSITSSFAVAGLAEALKPLGPSELRTSTRELDFMMSSSSGSCCASARSFSRTCDASRSDSAAQTRASPGLFSSRHETAMLMAVSRLSPVIIHTRMPASRRVAMHSGTPSWSLSSMAVMPTNSRSFSISPATVAVFWSRSPMSAAASWYLASQARHSSSESTFVPRQSVRRPWRANLWRLRWVSAARLSSMLLWFTSPRIVASAPLVKSRIVPSGDRAITLILRRSLVNSSTLRIS